MTRNAALPPTVLLLALLIGSPPHSHAGEPPSPPETPARPVVDEYHGVKVTDPYRWLEDGRSPEVKAWTAAQNRYARASLDALPALPAIRRRLERLQGAGSPDHFALRRRGGRLFALKSQPPKDQPLLVVMDSADRPETERVLVDPNALNPKGTTAIDFYVPSLDGRLVAVCMSENGTEDGTVRVFDAEGRPLPDVVPRVNGGTAGGSLAWNAEGTGFHYTRYPRAPERPREDLDFYQQVYFHRLGTPTADDRYVLGKDFPRIAEVELHTDAEGRFLLVSVANGDGGEFAHHLLGPSGTWTQISRFADKVVGAGFGGDGALYLLSRADAPMGKILRLPLPAAGSAAAVPPPAEAEVVVPAGDAAIEGFLAAETRLYVVDMVGGPSRVRVFDLGGRERTPVPLPPIASVGQLVRLDGDEILLRVETFLTPPAWHRFDPAAGRAMPTALKRTSPADFGDCEAVRETAVSKDGTRVPMTVLRRKGARTDGGGPALLTGYGGYGISQKPRFSASRKVWLEQGGIIAVANLRGGGEFGEDWHRGGNLTRKQNVFDDFLACARHLVAAGHARPGSLAIEGGSNGGLLMGAALTQEPGLFRAVVSHVGLYDMLRVERHPNGAFNVTEFGTVADPVQFAALHAYSPYHRVKDGTPYPAALLLTGENDPRVDPAHSRKMAARLQAAAMSAGPPGRPVLLLTTGGGHGIGSPLAERIARDADVYAFLFRQLGAEYVPVP